MRSTWRRRLPYSPLDLAPAGPRAEALARWTHPKRADAPQEFVTAAEQGGRIEKLTMFVLEHQRRWRSLQPRRRAVRVAVNLSARMLTMKSCRWSARGARAPRLDPARLTSN